MQDVFEKIIEKLEDLEVHFDNDYFSSNRETMVIKKDAIDIVNQEAEQYKKGWIQCSSGNMPDDLGDVLIDMGGRQYIPAYFHNGEWYLTDCRGSSEKVKDQSRVKAWHPLPQSYQQKGE